VKRNFAHRSVRADKSHSVREKNCDKAAAAAFARVAGFAGENSGVKAAVLTPRLQEMQVMFDAENPGRSGGLAGESYASVLENHPRYPSLRRVRDAALLARLDRTVEQNIKRFAALLLPPLADSTRSALRNTGQPRLAHSALCFRTASRARIKAG
jgi:hypothetical protein